MSGTQTHPSRLMEQYETVARLNALSNLDWTVEAEALDVDEHEGCANDTDHGPGTCYFGHQSEGVCPDCAVRYLSGHLLVGDYISVDVTR